MAGLSLGAGTDTWQLGVNYDWIRGNNGSTTQVGTLTRAGPHLSGSAIASHMRDARRRRCGML